MGWFANEDTSLYPFTFTDGGHITFTASAAAPTTVRFRFEKNPYPDTEPSFETATVLIDSDTPQQYSVQFGSQGENTFSSFLMYISEQDSPVVMTDVSVNQGPIPIVFSGVFGGSVVDLETSTLQVPGALRAGQALPTRTHRFIRLNLRTEVRSPLLRQLQRQQQYGLDLKRTPIPILSHRLIPPR